MLPEAYWIWRAFLPIAESQKSKLKNYLPLLTPGSPQGVHIHNDYSSEVLGTWLLWEMEIYIRWPIGLTIPIFPPELSTQTPQAKSHFEKATSITESF